MADTNRRRRRGTDADAAPEETPRRRRRAGGPVEAAPRRRRRGTDEQVPDNQPDQVTPKREGARVATEVTLPQLGESVTEGTITAWLAQVGDQVEADQPLFELSSDKIDTEVPSPASGTLTEIKVQVDETVDVGTVVAVIGGEEAGGGDSGGADTAGEPAAAEAPADSGGAPDVSDPQPGAADDTQEEGEGAEAAGTVDDREQVARDGDSEDTSAAEDAPAGAAAESSEGEKTEPTGMPAATGTYERSEGEVGAERTASGGPAPSGSGNGRGEGVLASPIVRRMVAENDLDISAITPTGEGGRVTREDVEAAIAGRGQAAPGQTEADQPEAQQTEPQAEAQQAEAAPQEAPAEQPAQREQPVQTPDTPSTTPPAQQAKPRVAPQPERRVSLEPGERERVESLSRIRQRIAAKMMESQQSSAQLTTVQEADMTRVMRLRERAKDDFKAREGVSLSPFAFLCRATVLVLRRPEFQMANAQADWDAGKVKFHDYVNLGIAVDTERGLLVPNIKSADDLTLPALARAIGDAANRARSKGQLEIADLEGGTFTVTNTGSRGVLIDTPILNYPEVGILGTGAIKKRPVVVSDENGDSISVRDMIYLCLTYDHRLLDGADAARFVTEVANVVETWDWAQEIGA